MHTEGPVNLLRPAGQGSCPGGKAAARQGARAHGFCCQGCGIKPLRRAQRSCPVLILLLLVNAVTP